MHVDLPADRVDEHEAPGRGTGDELVSDHLEQIDDAVRVPDVDDEVEVVVHPRLLPEQGVDAPAAVEPDVEAVLLEQPDDLEEA